MSRTNYSAYMAIKQQLLEIFKTETFENNKLPPEAVMAKRLGISLVTLREALLMLALEGYITKRHGSGNYIHPSALDYENRSYYFVDCLQHDGYKTSIKLLAQNVVPADEEVAAALHIAPGDAVLQNKICYLADDLPAVVSLGHIPISLIIVDNVKNMRFEFVHVLVQQTLGRDLAHSLNEYYPMPLPADVAELFQLPEGTPIIASRQTFYDVQDVAVLYNSHYFYPNVYRVKTLQNWALNN